MVDHPRQPNAPAPSRQDDADDAGPGERVAKALARAGVASRREVERLIEGGRVAINGKVLETPAVKVMPGDILTVDGAVIGEAEATRLWRYHKPAGLMTTHSDPQGRATVFQHLPEGLPRVISVGRLDLNTEGLLLLTNDGGLSRALELPATGWVRRYRARAFGHTTQAKLDKLKDGITVEGVAYGPIEARLDKAHTPYKEGGPEKEKGPANLWITLSLTEGKNREVRRVLEAIGLKVNRLIRLSYGPFALGTLEVGQVEEVGPRVIREQLVGLIAPENMPKGDRRAGPVLTGAPAPGRRASSNTASGGGPRPSLPRERAVAKAEPEKKEYKPGWAKPKSKASPHPVPKKKKNLGPGLRRDERRREAEKQPAWAGKPPQASRNPDGSRAERKAAKAGGPASGPKPDYTKPKHAKPARPSGRVYGLPQHGEAHERNPWDAPKGGAPKSDAPAGGKPRRGPPKPRR
jgi:23S rRNA pseudouridine2605 synthase